MRPRPRLVRACGWVLSLTIGGCAHGEVADLGRASRGLGRAIGRGHVGQVEAATLPAIHDTLDLDRLMGPERRRAWARDLAHPVAISPRAILLLSEGHPIDVVLTAEGWRFAEDPTDVFAQDTPRHALRAFVLASRLGRWDVLIRLAPRRFRVGLSRDDLEKAWSEGEQAEVMTGARDRISEHLADPIAFDAHEAVLLVSDDHLVRLEREGDRWVLTEFLPQ